MPNINAKQDSNQIFTQIGLQGTLGTADANGTAPTIPFSADPATGAQYVYNLGPAGSVSLGDITGGTIDNITSGTLDVNILSGSVTATPGDTPGGTINLLEAGTINTVPNSQVATDYFPVRLSNGTAFYTADGGAGGGTVIQVAAGSVAIVNGTIDAFTADIPGGTIDAITTIPNTPGGTLNLVSTLTTLGTVQNVGVIHNAGTIAALPDLPGGTIDLVTTVSNLTNGSVAITAGTISAFTADIPGGTIDSITALPNITVGALPDTPGGTIDSITRIDTIGTLEVGTVNVTIGESTGGTLDLLTSLTTLGTVQNIGQIHNAGTIAALPNIPGGTINALTTVSNLTNGSVAVTAGTINAFTADIPGGTIDSITRIDTIGTLEVGTIDVTIGESTGGTLDLLTSLTTLGTVQNLGQVHNAGTIAALPDLPGGTIDLITTVSNLTNGSVVMTNGTIGAFTADIPGGTIDAITNITGGTIQINPRPSRNILTYGTTVTQGTAQFTLLTAPGSGTAIWINDISVLNSGTAANRVSIGFGTADVQGSPRVLSGNYGANGGHEKPFPVPVNGNVTDHALVGTLAAAGTVDINLTYWIQ